MGGVEVVQLRCCFFYFPKAEVESGSTLLSTAYYEENLWLITSFIPFNALHFVASLQLGAKIIDSFSQWWFCGREPRIMVMQRRTLRAKYCKKEELPR